MRRKKKQHLHVYFSTPDEVREFIRYLNDVLLNFGRFTRKDILYYDRFALRSTGYLENTYWTSLRNIEVKRKFVKGRFRQVVSIEVEEH